MTDNTRELLEVLRFHGLGLTQIFRNGPAGDFMDTEGDGAAADAVDTEHEVEQGTKRGQRPDDTDPNCCSTGVAFVEQGVAGREQAGEQIKSGGEVRPESGNMFEPVHWRPYSTEARMRASPARSLKFESAANCFQTNHFNQNPFACRNCEQLETPRDKLVRVPGR